MSHIWHPYTRFSAIEAGLPPGIVKGEGIYLIDETGTRYVDAVSSWWCAALGHSHPAIVSAIQSQAETLQHSILGNLVHPTAISVAETLCELMPDPQRHVHFAGDGASSVEVALKIALQYAWNTGQTERTQFVSLQHAYHGDTLGTISLGYIDSFHRPFKSMLHGARTVPVPPYDAPLSDCLAAARSIISEAGDRLAGVIVEPLCQGAAGMRVYPVEFLRELRAACAAAGGIFIVDEIAMGFLRTGRMFAFEHAGIDPDIVCVAKALSAGALPISAAIVKDSIYEAFSDSPVDHTLYHGHTFAGNPIACAAANVALAEYRKPEMQAHVDALSARMAAGIESLSRLPGVTSTRSLGVMGAVELDRPQSAVAVQERMRQRGILLRPLGAVLYLMPPLIIGTDTLADLIAALGESLSA